MASYGVTAAQLSDRDWTLRAACRHSGLDPDTWFPTPGDEASANAAKRICRTCPVQIHCGVYAEQIRATHGIWAGNRRNIHGKLSGFDRKARA